MSDIIVHHYRESPYAEKIRPYAPIAAYAGLPCACGRVPRVVAAGHGVRPARGPLLLHMGYALRARREAAFCGAGDCRHEQLEPRAALPCGVTP